MEEKKILVYIILFIIAITSQYSDWYHCIFIIALSYYTALFIKGKKFEWWYFFYITGIMLYSIIFLIKHPLAIIIFFVATPAWLYIIK